MEEICPFGTWKKAVKKFDSKLEISKYVEEFIVHMPFVFLAYHFSAY